MSNETKLYKDAERKLEAYIGSHGLRHTPERYTILRYICSLGTTCFTAEDIVKKAEEDFISKATVYNTLSLLVSAQILWGMGKRGLKAEYELIQGGKMRMQIQCKKCGRVSEFKDLVIENHIRQRKYSKFTMEYFTVLVYGVCKACKDKEKQMLHKKKRAQVRAVITKPETA